MLRGVVPFPEEFSRRYRARGYWSDKSLADEFKIVFERYGDRVAVIDGERCITYAELDRLSDNLALNLLAAGVEPLDRLVVQLPNVAEFLILYFALQKIGCIPIAALASHRYAEISQFVALSGATTCVVPEKHGDFDYGEMIERIRKESPSLKRCIVLGQATGSLLSLSHLIETPAALPASKLSQIHIDPENPAIFQLSGGTTGVPKLIPRSNNDYAYNSKAAAAVCGIDETSVLLVVLPIAHNLPLACPGIQGFMFHGAKAALSTSTKPADMCALIAKHKVTHLKVVPALLIRLLNDPAVHSHDLSSLKVIQSGGQCLQPGSSTSCKKIDSGCVRTGKLRNVRRSC